MVRKREGKNVEVNNIEKEVLSSIILKDFLDTLEIGGAIAYKNLTIFPVFRTLKKRVEKLKTLSEAIEAGIVEIRETGIVAQVEIINKSEDTKILILEGETIKGGAQNRAINTSIILDEKSSVKIPTTCVQQSRWNTFDAPFLKTGSLSPSSSSSMSSAVSRSMMLSHSAYRKGERETLSYMADQGKIWGEINSQLNFVGAGDDTKDIHSAYEKKKADIDSVYEKLKPYLPISDDWVGLVGILNNEWVLMDICDEYEIAKNHLEKILRGYIYEAVVSEKTVECVKTQDDIINLLAMLDGKQYEEFDSLTKNGKELRYAKDKETISILLYKNNVIHIIFSRR